HVKVNNADYKVEISHDQFLLNGKSFQWDLVNLEKGQFHILHENESFNAEIISINHEQKKVNIRINGNDYEVVVESELDQLLQKMGMHAGASHKINHIKAPMPGLVLSILVSEGQQVNAGDSVLILEAMKMEN